MAVYTLTLAEAPMVVRVFLLCRMSRVTIMRVRRTLSETEIERDGILGLDTAEPRTLLFGPEAW